MRIVVTSADTTLDSAVDVRFGRAKYLTVVDTESGEFEITDNKQNINAPQGAGIQTGQRVVDFGAEVVITGNVGPKAFRVLDNPFFMR